MSQNLDDAAPAIAERPKYTWRRAVLALVFSAYLVFLFSIAVFLFHHKNATVNLVPFRTIIRDLQAGGRPFVVDFVGNLVAFLPVGFMPPLIRLRRTSVGQVALFSLLFSASIEACQYVSGLRFADVDDLILNALGGVLGYGLFAGMRAWQTSRAEQQGT